MLRFIVKILESAKGSTEFGVYINFARFGYLTTS